MDEGRLDLFSAITRWMSQYLTPDIKRVRGAQIAYILDDNQAETTLESIKTATLMKGVELSLETEVQHSFVMKVLELFTSVETLSQMKFYFLRYPFSKLPVTRGHHLRNVSEFYLFQFYVIRCRLKACLNLHKKLSPESNLKVEPTLRSFDKIFDFEIRSRNQITHHSPLQELSLERLELNEILGMGEDPIGHHFKQTALAHYRRYSKEWSLLAARRSDQMRNYIGGISKEILLNSPFLQLLDQG